MKIRTLLTIGAATALAACAGPEFPKEGTASPYDGTWKGTLVSDNLNCSGLTVNGEVKYGYLISTVRETATGQSGTYQIWGQIDESGKLAGKLGQQGITGGYATVDFTARKATGTWGSHYCDGTLSAEKVAS